MNMPVNFTDQQSQRNYKLLDKAYVIITLGNPKQDCKFFGICKTEVYDAAEHDVEFQSLTNHCLGQCIAIDFLHKEIEIYFPYNGMSAQVLERYFSGNFQIMSAFEFPKAICEAWNTPPFTILPGHYAITRELKGLSIHFSTA